MATCVSRCAEAFDTARAVSVASRDVCHSAALIVRDFESGLSDRSPTASRPLVAKTSVASDTVEIVVAKLDAGVDALRASAALLSDEEQQRASRFVFDHDRRRFVAARARLRQLLAARLNVRPESVELVYGAHGKPTLARHFADPDLRFNVSHCEDIAVYAFARGREIGIDVETVRVIRDAADVAARFFSRLENEAYLALDPGNRPLGFFTCWTRKEAFIKAIGEGLSHPLDEFDVSLAPDEPARLLRIGSTPWDRCGWRMEGFSPAPGFVAAVVFENGKRRDGPTASSLRSAHQVTLP